MPTKKEINAEIENLESQISKYHKRISDLAIKYINIPSEQTDISVKIMKANLRIKELKSEP